MSNSFGKIFHITTFGESHGHSVGVVIDGCPSNINIDIAKIQKALNRRRPGQSHITSPRDEQDQVTILSGVENNLTLGTPITLVVKNKDYNPNDYKDISKVFRPSHADYTTQAKYGIRSQSGGGRSSARETIGRVAAGAVAEQVLEVLAPKIKIVAWVQAVKNLKVASTDYSNINRELIERSIIRSLPGPHHGKMLKLIEETQEAGDSLGGIVKCLVLNPTLGLGEPVFDKLEADLAKAIMSIPATKGFEVGLGFASTSLYGSEHNDHFTVTDNNQIKTLSNRSGGIQGGISNGETIYFQAAFKPTSTIFKEQETVDEEGKKIKFKPKSGRHDACVLPRAVPIVEAMTSIVILDHYLQQQAITHS